MPENSTTIDANQQARDLARSMAHHPAGKGTLPLTAPLPEVVSAVTVTDPVDGTTKKRKPRSDKGKPRDRRRLRLVAATEHLVVAPEVMAKAKQAKRPGERLVIVSATEVRLVPVS